MSVVTLLVVVHAAGAVALLGLGLLALTAPKTAASRHTLVGELYFWTLLVSLPPGMLYGLIQHPSSFSIFQAVTPPTLAFGILGYVMAKRRPPVILGRPWLFWHILGQSSSFIGVVTGASFQSFPRFLPDAPLLTMAYWILPTAVGVLLVRRTIARWLPRIRSIQAASPATS
jgi:hypothetical protein